MPTVTRRKKKPKVTKARFTHKTKDGTTITGDLDPEDAAARMAEDDDEEAQEDREYIDAEPQSEAEQVMNAYGAASFSEYRLFRQNPETKQFLFVTTLNAEVAKNPQLIAEQEGGGNYQLQIFENGQLIRTIQIPIDGPPKLKPQQPQTTFIMPNSNGSGNSDLASIVQLIVAQGQQQQALLLGVIQAVFNRPKEETKFDDMIKLAQVMGKGDNGSALVKDLFGFMGDAVKTISSAIGGQPDSPLMFALQKIAPAAESLIQKFTTRQPYQMPPAAAIPGATGPQPVQPQAAAAQPAQANGEQQRREYIAMVFTQHLYPQLLRAASELFPDGEWMRQPESIAEALEVEYSQLGNVKTLMLEFLETEDETTAKGKLFARFPDMQRPELREWFDELWEALMLGPEGRRARDEQQEHETEHPRGPLTPIVIQEN